MLGLSKRRGKWHFLTFSRILRCYGTPDRRDPEVTQWVQTLTDRYAGVKLVVGRDKLDEVQVSPSFLPPPDDLLVHLGRTT